MRAADRSPRTWLQLVNVGPMKMFLTVAVVMFARWLDGVGDDAERVAGDPGEHQAARVAAAGSREDAPIETRPFATSETPTFEPPWRILKPYFLPFLVLIQARRAGSPAGRPRSIR